MNLLALDDLALGIILTHATAGSAYCMSVVLMHVCKRFYRFIDEAKWPPKTPPALYIYPVHHGHLELVKWFWANHVAPLEGWLYRHAAGNGQLDVMKWLKSKEVLWFPDMVHNAASYGDVSVLEWIKANGPMDIGPLSCTNAARNGHLEALKWLRANEVQWEGWTVVHAAANGHDEVVDWLSAAGAPWCDLYLAVQNYCVKKWDQQKE